MKNLTFKAAMLKGSRTTVNRQSTDGQSQRHCKQTPLSKRWKVLMTLVFLFTFAIGNVWAAAHSITPNKTGTNYEIYQIAHQNNQSGTVIKSKQSTFNAEFTSWCSGSIYDYTGSIPTIPSAIADNWLAQTTKGAKVRQPGLTFEVTNCVGVTILGKANGSGDSKKWTLSVKSGGVEVGTVASDNTTSVHELSYGTTLSATETYTITVASSGASSNIELYQIRFEAPATTTKYSVIYKAGDGTGDDVVDSDAKTVKAFADCSFTAPTGYEFKEWQDGSSNVVEAGASVSDNMTLTAIYRLIPTKYTVTYDLNGASGDAPTETSKAKDDVFNLAAAPSWAGHAFDGWLCSADAAVKAAGSSYKMTAANTTFTAQWHELDCKIYSFTGGIGSAIKESSDKASVDADKLVLSGSAGVIKLVPAAGETFKAGDVITISGMVGNTAEAFGVKISASNAKGDDLGTASVAGTTIPLIASVALTGNADNLYISRKGGTTTTIYTCEVHRSCADGAAAGLAYATAEVAKTEGDAAFTNALTNANGLVIAGYKSSNTAVATVAANGQVTVVGPGSATITAYSAVQTKAGTLYAAGTASYTLTVAALPKYHVTYDLNGGSGDVAEVDHKAGEKFNLHDGVTGITAPANKTFINWKDQDDNLYEGGAEFTMPGKDVTLTAQWAGDVYTVKYMDGETLLDTKVVEVGSSPTDIEHPTKQMFTFAAWQKEGVDIALDDESWTSVAKDAEIILTVRWAKAYANSVDFVKKITDDGTSGWAAYLEANNYYIASTEGVSFDNNNAFDTGLKMKTTIGNTLSFTAAAGKVIDLTVGNISGMTIAINSGEASAITSGTDATHLAVSHYYAAGEQEVVLTETVTGYNIIRQITIRDPFTVTFDANGGEDVASLNGTPSVTLPLPVKGTESFLGWFDGETNVGMNGDKYTPTDNITLKAHWEAVSTDARLASITFSATGTLSPAFDPEVTSYTYTMPYGTAAIPTITGATSVNAKAQEPVIVQQAAAWNETAIIRGKAQSGDTKAYNVTMKMAPKDGVCLVWGDIPSDNTITYNATNSKVYKAEEVSLVTNVNGKDDPAPSGVKFQNNDYVKVALNEGTFKAGDILALDVTYGTANKMYVYKAQSAAAADIIGELDGTTTPAGLNKVAITEDAAALWLVRAGQSSSWNPHVDYVAVYRIMNPELMAITIDGRAGEIDPLDDKHFNVQIPYEADLANLTIVPTIAWNAPAAEGSIVVNNGGAWVEGNNTYKLTDKDGDYTVYTLTLTRDVLKHAVKFYDGETLLETLEVEDGTSIAAGDVPADPEKEDYIFQGWAETADGAAVDVTSFTISAAKNFYAKWAADGAIKLLNGATVNHTNFITGVTADETVEFKGNEVHYAKFSGTVSGVNGVKDLTRVIAYNATTNKTKIQISAHNNSTSGRSILVKGLVEGASAAVDLATIDLGNKEDKVSEWIEFNNAANRTIYIMVSSSAGDVYFTQVKVIESGETEMKQVGEVGYALNLNKGRFFGLANTDLAFEGLNARLNGDYTALNSDYAKLKATSMSFTVASDMNLVVTTNNSKTYYVTKGAAGTDNETAKTGVSEFDLTAGTWYITAGSSEVQFTNIAFALPKCQKPTIETQPATKLDFGAGDMTATVVATADGTLSYQWFNASDDSEVAGATEATLTTATEGTYYVVVTNSKAGYQDNTIKSDNAELKHRQINDATLSALSYGGTAITLEVGVYEYAVLLDEGTTVVPALSATATMAAYGATAVPTDAAAFVDYKATSTVLVTAEDGATTQTYTVKFTVQHEYTEIEDVTGNTSWNWAGVADVTEGDGIVVDGSHGLVLANYIAAVNFEKLEAHVGARAYRSNSYPAYQGTSLKFHATVAGKLVINARRSSGSPLMKVNGAEIATLTSTLTEYVTFVPAGDVTITVTGNEMRIYSMEFQVLSVITPNYTRDNLNPNNIGTLCWKNDGVLFGGTVYELTGKDENSKLVFDEVIGNVIKGGKPCIFVPENGNTEIKVYNTKNDDVDAGEFNGMKGTYEVLSTIADGENSPLWGNYIISNNKYIYVDYNNCRLGEYRAYIMPLENVPSADPNPSQGAPRRRLVVGGNQAPTVVTDVENLNASEQPVKLLINGQIFILRGEKMFDATGRLVK